MFLRHSRIPQQVSPAIRLQQAIHQHPIVFLGKSIYFNLTNKIENQLTISFPKFSTAMTMNL